MKKYFFILLFLFSISFMFFSCKKESLVVPLDAEHIEWKGLWENDVYRIELRKDGHVAFYTNDAKNLKKCKIIGGQKFNGKTLSIIHEFKGKSLIDFSIDDFPTETLDDNGFPYKYITLNGQKLIYTK